MNATEPKPEILARLEEETEALRIVARDRFLEYRDAFHAFRDGSIRRAKLDAARNAYGLAEKAFKQSFERVRDLDALIRLYRR